MLPALALDRVDGHKDRVQAHLVDVALPVRALGRAAGAVLAVAAGLLLADGQVRVRRTGGLGSGARGRRGLGRGLLAGGGKMKINPGDKRLARWAARVRRVQRGDINFV